MYLAMLLDMVEVDEENSFKICRREAAKTFCRNYMFTPNGQVFVTSHA
jgi:hypothetical protein